MPGWSCRLLHIDLMGDATVSPRSLDRAARRKIGRVTPPPAGIRWLRALGRSWWITLLLLAVGIGGLFLGRWGFAHFGVAWWSEVGAARSYVETLLQVQAGLLALPVALILFALEAIRASGVGISLREFTREGSFILMVALGLAGIVTGAASLLVPSSDGRLEWDSAWVTAFLAFFALLFAPVLRNAIRSNDPAALRSMRMRRLRGLIAGVAATNATQAAGFAFLERWCTGRGISFQPFAAQRDVSTSGSVTAPSAGRIRDINLRRLAGLLEGREQSSVHVYLGKEVRESDPVFTINGLTESLARKTRRALKYGPIATGDPVDALLAELHTEGLDAIRRNRPSQYRQVEDAYREVVDMVRTAQLQSPGSFPSSIELRLEGPDLINVVARYLYEEFQLIVDGAASEIGRFASFAPVSNAIRAIEARTHLTIEPMLELAAAEYEVARSGAQRERSLRLDEKLVLHFNELARFYVEPRIVQGIWAEDRSERAKILAAVFRGFNLFLRKTIEQGDYLAFESLDTQWTELPEDWHPEYASPGSFDVRAAIGRFGEDSTEVRRLKEEAAPNIELAEIKRQLEELRAAMRVGLAMWTIYRMQTLEPAPTLGKMLVRIAQDFKDLDEVLRAGAIARQLDRDGSISWWAWFLAGSVYSPESDIQVDARLLEAMLVLSAVRVDVQAGVPHVAPLDWLPGQLQVVDSHLERIADRAGLLAGVSGFDDMEQRVSMLREALHNGAREQERIDAVLVRGSPLSARKVKEFTDALVGAWREHRLLADLCRIAGRYEVCESEEGMPETLWRDDLLPKQMFLEKSSYVGNDMFARDVGGRIGQRQLESALLGIGRSERPGEPELSLAVDLRAQISSMTERGLVPRAILIPASRYAMKELGLLSSVGHASPPSEWLDAPSAARSYRGEFEGIPVLQYFAQAFSDRVFLIDTMAWATWREWTKPEVAPEGLAVELHEFDREDALHYLLDRDGASSGADADSSETQVDEIMGQVRVRISEQFLLDVTDSTAALWLKLPDASE